MADIEETRRKIDKLITEKGFNYRDVSLKIGRKDSYMQQYVKYGYPRRLKEIDRMRLAKLLGVEDSEIMDDEIIASKTIGTPDVKLDVISDIIKASCSPESELVSIDVLNPMVRDNQSNNVIGKHLISKNVLDDITLERISDIKIIKITNDAMKPTVNSGDMVWFDTSFKRPEGDGLYLIAVGREVMVKRIQTSPLDGSIVLASDNPQYAGYTASGADEIKTLGKVIYIFQKI